MHEGFLVVETGQAFDDINGLIDRMRWMSVEILFQSNGIFFEWRVGADIIVSLETCQSFGEKQFDVRDQRVSFDTEVFADDMPFDILGDEQNGVQFLADFRIGTGKEFLPEQGKCLIGKGYFIHELFREQKKTETQEG